MQQEDNNGFGLLQGTTGFGYNNFNPSSIQEDEVILLVFAVDISGSVQSFEKELNEAFSEFVAEMQKSHVAPKLMVKVITFGSKVYEKTGFMPILQLDPATMVFKATDGSTCLFDACKRAVEVTVAYRTQLENTGINVKTLIFTITDGDDNVHRTKASEVAALLDNIAKDERNIFSFETFLFGVGDSKTTFESAQKEMHFKHLGVVGQSAAEIRKMIGMISASVSKSNSNQAQGVAF